MPELDTLFRTEALEARKRRVEGEIVLAQPLRTRSLVLLLFGLIVLLVAWLSAGTYTRSEATRGILVTDTASTKIVALRPGRVIELRVKEGDPIRAGQALAIIHTEEMGLSGRSAISDSLEAINRQEALTRQQLQLAGERAASERARLSASLQGVLQQLGQVGEQISLQEEATASAAGMVQRVTTLLERGFISQFEVERRRQAHIVARQELVRLQQQRSALGAEQERLAAELARVAADAGTDLVAVQSSAETLNQQRSRLSAERAYTIFAPIAGRISGVQTAVGRTADANIPLMEIIPENSKLHADIYAPTRAIGFVRPGQRVRLLYDAFPYQRFGSFSGRVTRVSRSVIDPRQLAAPLGIQEAVYRIEVEPESQDVSAYGQQLSLQPGMTLTANIILDRRSFLGWLLQPIRAVSERNG